MPIQITCDDFGLGSRINGAIEEWIETGLADAVSILATGPEANAAIEVARSRPRHVHFGAHLDAVEFEPLDRDGRGSRMAGPDGRFTDRLQRRDAPLSPSEMRALYREWDAQVSHLVQRGVDVAYLDTHAQIHARPEVLGVLCLVGRRHRVRYIRSSRNLYRPDETPRRLKSLLKGGMRMAIRSAGFRTARYFTDLSTLLELHRTDRLPPEPTSIECMCHPGHPTYEDEHETALSSGFFADLADRRRPVL